MLHLAQRTTRFILLHPFVSGQGFHLRRRSRRFVSLIPSQGSKSTFRYASLSSKVSLTPPPSRIPALHAVCCQYATCTTVVLDEFLFIRRKVHHLRAMPFQHMITHRTHRHSSSPRVIRARFQATHARNTCLSHSTHMSA